MKRLLILSGPTHEYIDPVRFIGNASSGKMGKAIAEEAVHHNYVVDFLTGPVAETNLPQQQGIHIHHVTSAEDMLATAEPLFYSADIIIFAAAVADYTPAEKLVEKIAKSTDELTLRLRPTPDIAKTLCIKKRPDQITIGFALQTSNGEAHARRKLKEKNLNGIVLNTPTTLGATDGTFHFLPMNATSFEKWGHIDKATCAQHIFSAIADLQHISHGR